MYLNPASIRVLLLLEPSFYLNKYGMCDVRTYVCTLNVVLSQSLGFLMIGHLFLPPRRSTHIRKYLHMHACVYTCTHTYVCIHMNTYVCIHMYTQLTNHKHNICTFVLHMYVGMIKQTKNY